MAPRMKRREFIAFLGGAAATSASPLPARAQQAAMPVVGYLMSRSAATSEYLADEFRRGLREAGFTEGRNVEVQYRWADGHFERLPAIAQELARFPVAVMIAAGGEPTAMAASAATSTIPIVFGISGDPIKLGLARSFNRPGKNLTGVSILTATLEPKRLGLLHDLVPQATTVAALVNANFAPAESQTKDLLQAAAQAGLELRIFRVSTDREIEFAFESIVKERIFAVEVASSPYFDTNRAKIIALAAHHGVPAIYQFREYAVSGGLMSYGIDLREVHRQLGLYAGQILKGAKPGDLPIVLPRKFEFVINLKTAKAIGLTVPPTLLARADEVIE
jgi:putative ABC transport system substrate-binding protein